jgi:hypothetical protein
MMEDNRVARAFLSAIIQEEVLELDFAPQEHTIHVSDEKEKKDDGRELNLTVCRFDFSARIAVPEGGHKTVLIELQKAKLSSDIMRFRRYLGLHYHNPDNVYGSEDNRKARQLYCIFLLGYDVGLYESPVVQIDPRAKDVATNRELQGPNVFIESLHHRSWIVQIALLKYHRRTDMEKLLSIFDQENRTKNHHILNVNEDDFPEQYRPIIRRLRMASESEQIQIEMEMEDDYLKELRDKERKIAQREKIIEEQGKTIEEQGKALEEKDKALEKQEKELEKQGKALEEKDRVIEELKKQLAQK